MPVTFKKPPLYLFTIALLFFFTFSILFRADHSFDQDMGRHLKMGEIISYSRSIPNNNLFSYTYPDFPFINHHWLFELLSYQGKRLMGMEFLLIIKVVLFLASVLLILRLPSLKNSLLTLPLSFLFLHVLRERTEFRPEILSFFFTALTVYILKRFELGKTPLVWILPPLQLVWVNTHIYFPLGLVIQSIYLAQFSIQRRGGQRNKLFIILLFSVLASLINPNTLTGFLYPLTIFRSYGYQIVENQTLFFLESINFADPNFLFVKLAVAITFLSVILALIKKNLQFSNLCLAALGVILALLNVRSFPYLYYLTLPACLENFGMVKRSYLSLGLYILVTFLLIYEGIFYLNGNYYRFKDSDIRPVMIAEEHGKNALDFVTANNLPGPIFNNFDIGSYIIYRTFPRYKVFVDGRPEAYPTEFFQQVYIPLQTSQEELDKAVKQWGFKTIIFSHTDQTPWGKQFLASMVKNPAWKTVFLDDFMIVLVKNEVVEAKRLEVLNLDKLKPQSFGFPTHSSYLKISLFLLNLGRVNQAGLFAKEALRRFPESPTGNLVVGEITRASGNFSDALQAEQYLKKASNPIWW